MNFGAPKIAGLRLRSASGIIPLRTKSSTMARSLSEVEGSVPERSRRVMIWNVN